MKGKRTAQGTIPSSFEPRVARQSIPVGYHLEAPKSRASRAGAVALEIVFALIAAAVVVLVFWLISHKIGLAALLVAALAALLVLCSVHVVMEWEKAMVMRFGLVFTIPLIEFYTIRIDQRVASTYFGAEETLTADLVPVNVDAVLFWWVYNAKNATVEVEDYATAVSWIAQTTMRQAIGRATVAEVATRRDQLDEELKAAIEEKLGAWGIDIIAVEVRDIIIPKELQEAMAAEAIANRKKNARMVLAEAERDISEMLKDASDVYAEDAVAMKLRTMHLAYESVEKSGGTVVLPSAFSEGFVADANQTAQ